MSYKQTWQSKVYQKRLKEKYPDNWPQLRATVLKRDNYRCYRCEKRNSYGKGLTVHHIIPRDENGPDDIPNLITLCNSCHDYVEVKGLRSKAEIAASIELDIEEKPDKPEILREETFIRPDWHAWVYGGARRPEKQS